MKGKKKKKSKKKKGAVGHTSASTSVPVAAEPKAEPKIDIVPHHDPMEAKGAEPKDVEPTIAIVPQSEPSTALRHAKDSVMTSMVKKAEAKAAAVTPSPTAHAGQRRRRARRKLVEDSSSFWNATCWIIASITVAIFHFGLGGTYKNNEVEPQPKVKKKKKKYTGSGSGTTTTKVAAAPSGPAPLNIKLNGGGANAFEVTCPSGFRQRTALSGSGSGTLAGVPQESCTLFFKGGSPAKYGPVSGGKSLNCQIVGTTANCK